MTLASIIEKILNLAKKTKFDKIQYDYGILKGPTFAKVNEED